MQRLMEESFVVSPAPRWAVAPSMIHPPARAHPLLRLKIDKKVKFTRWGTLIHESPVQPNGTLRIFLFKRNCNDRVPKLSGQELAFYQACMQHSRPPDCRCPQYSGGEMPQLPPGKEGGWSRNEVSSALHPSQTFQNSSSKSYFSIRYFNCTEEEIKNIITLKFLDWTRSVIHRYNINRPMLVPTAAAGVKNYNSRM